MIVLTFLRKGHQISLRTSRGVSMDGLKLLRRRALRPSTVRNIVHLPRTTVDLPRPTVDLSCTTADLPVDLLRPTVDLPRPTGAPIVRPILPRYIVSHIVDIAGHIVGLAGPVVSQTKKYAEDNLSRKFKGAPIGGRFVKLCRRNQL